MNSSEPLPIHVLLVDDNPGDVRLTREAFKKADVLIVIHVSHDGVDAMRFLRQEGLHELAPRPDLILLDLNLPRMDGREVLAAIKADADLKAIPTVMLTTSGAASDVETSYRLHANSYVTKPVELERFEALVASINDFWLTKALRPSLL